ncbi:hypothetical protein ACIBAG_35355 [Streptomyces sp. NPDC051243]|uniref:hypothetical protein n=1 Tax=Streptomyces sp. NPDC051243 TaxID=3365646 RepID=UPI0037BD6BC6
MPDVTKAAPLLAHEERDKLELRLQQAVAHFVDQPRAAVEEADHAVEDIVGRFTEAVAERRRTLRRAWQSTDGTAEVAETNEIAVTADTADTEQLRLALRDYRELAERLLRT